MLFSTQNLATQSSKQRYYCHYSRYCTTANVLHFFDIIPSESQFILSWLYRYIKKCKGLKSTSTYMFFIIIKHPERFWSIFTKPQSNQHNIKCNANQQRQHQTTASTFLKETEKNDLRLPVKVMGIIFRMYQNEMYHCFVLVMHQKYSK
jgi:hypothetical protein